MNKLSALFISSPEGERDNNINLMRFVSAAMVVYGHMAHFIGVPVPMLFGQEISHIAVKVFFILSGYLITKSFLHDGNVFRYLVRRAFRIFPALIFVAFMLAFIIGPIMSTLSPSEYFSNANTYRYFVFNSLLHPEYNLPGVFADNPYQYAVNGSLWTLPVEFSMYLLLPMFVMVFRKLNCIKAGLLVAAIAISVLEVLHLALFPTARFVIWGTDVFQGLDLAPFFFLGSLYVFPEIKKTLNVQVAFLLAVILGFLTAGITTYWKSSACVIAILPYVTLALALASPAVFGRVFATEDYSYGLYVWGFPIQQCFVAIFGAGFLSLIPYSLVCFIVATICGMISWFFVEKPCGKLGKRITKWSRSREDRKRAERANR